MRCSYCERRCEIAEDKTGFCRMYTVSGGVIRERFPHCWSSCGASVMEAIPFYHIYPGSRCLIIGTTGCNFRCRYCSNAYARKGRPGGSTGPDIPSRAPRAGRHGAKAQLPQHSIQRQRTCRLSANSTQVAQEAKAAAIPMGCLTNGYTTIESTELLASLFFLF